MANPFPFSSGDVLTAANLNAIGEWTAFTPSWNNVTVGNGSTVAYYATVNETMFLSVRFTLGSTSAITGSVSMELPAGATANSFVTGDLLIRDFGSRYYQGPMRIANNSNDVVLGVYTTYSSYISQAAIAATIPMTWTNDDWFAFSLVVDIS